MRLSLRRKDEASSNDGREGNQHMTEYEEIIIRPEPVRSTITILPLEDVVTTVVSVSRTSSQNGFDEPQITPPPAVVISTLESPSMSSSETSLDFTQSLPNVITHIQQNSNNINRVDQSLSPTPISPFCLSQRSKMTIQMILAILLIGTIAGYTILIMKYEPNLPIFVHVVFVFLIIVEISFIERWYTAQRIHNEWELGSNGATTNGRAVRLWAPWNDPELQHSRVAVAEFDPECPQDFIPPPAYGNLRDSVLINPGTGQIINHLESSQITDVDGGADIPPNYDALSVRSSRRTSGRTIEENANASLDNPPDGINV